MPVVEEVYVGAGDTVEEGTALYKINDESIVSIEEYLEEVIKESQTAYKEAKLQYASDLLTAEMEYATNKNLAGTASEDYNSTEKSLSLEVESAQYSYEEAVSIIAENPDKISAKEEKIKNLKAKISSLENRLETLQSKADTAHTKFEAAESTYENAKTSSENAAAKLEAKQTALSEKQSSLTYAEQQLETWRTDLENAENNIEALKAAYDKATVAQDTNERENRIMYVETGETASYRIPVGTTVTTTLGAKTTFSRLAEEDTIKIVLEKDDSGNDVIVGIWIVE